MVGVLAGLVTWLSGVDFPLIWGMLAFFLHYIPVIGAFVAGIPPVLLALAVLGPARALLLTLAFLAINFVVGNLLEPFLMGRPLGLSPLVANFCSYLIDQRRTRDLAVIRDEFVRLAEEAAGRVRGELVTAAPLDAAALDRVRGALKRRVGREIELSVRVDPELVGGLVARVGDLVFDGSLRSQLAQLRAQLTGER